MSRGFKIFLTVILGFAVLITIADSLAMLLPALSNRASASSIAETKRRGDLIVQALDKYYADHGQYPAALTDLCPQYLKDIPAPDWGLRVWKYDRADKWGKAGHLLTFGVDEDEFVGNGDSHWLRYAGAADGWQMGD